MRIGELARKAGTSTRSLRYYEEQGLLSARRTANGHRDYDESDLRLVNEIRGLLTIGFALEETRPFVECLRSGHETGDACPASVEVYRRKLAEVEDYLSRLTAVRDHLRAQLSKTDDQEESCRALQPFPDRHSPDQHSPDPCRVPEPSTPSPTTTSPKRS